MNLDTDPNKYSYYGEANLTNGLVVRHGINGVGLVTRGFVWQMFDVFIDIASVDALVTTWSNSDATITTTWSDSDSAITTSWTNVQFGIWGDYLP